MWKIKAKSGDFGRQDQFKGDTVHFLQSMGLKSRRCRKKNPLDMALFSNRKALGFGALHYETYPHSDGYKK